MGLAENTPYIIGVTGGSASGKTTFLELLRDRYAHEQLAVISQDHYYKALSEQIRDEKGEVNFDLPDGVDFKRLVTDVRKLKRGKAVQITEYTFNNPSVFPKQIQISPAPIILIEGLFIFTDERLSTLIDLSIFIEAKPEIMFERRLRRDSDERGMSREQIHYQWENHVLPSYRDHLLPMKDHVDMVLVNNKHLKNSFKVITDHIDSVLGNTI